MTLWNYLVPVALLASFGVHEVGHYVTAKIFGYEAHFTIHKGNPSVSMHRDDNRTPGFKTILSAGPISQILFGLPFLIFGQQDLGAQFIMAIAIVGAGSLDYKMIIQGPERSKET